MWYFIRQRGRRPLVVRINVDSAQGHSTAHGALDGRLLAYLAADAYGNYVIAPGAGGPAAPSVTTEALEPSYGWQAALLRMAVARQPSYLVDVGWSEVKRAGDGQRHQAVVRISRTPGDRIVASDSFREQSEDDLIQAVGCFCITLLRGLSRTLQQTPRWERWGQSIQGYRAYRRGLEYQQRAELRPVTSEQRHAGRHELDDYKHALQCFHEAARYEPANLLVQLHRAALLEVTGEYSSAVDIYQKCHTLWPEHIESSYRLGTARKSFPDQVTHSDLMKHLNKIEDQLALRRLIKAWCRTLRPWRWNAGERRYWRSWLQVRLPGRVTRRATYIHAVAIAKLLAELSLLLGQPQTSAGPDVMRTMDELMTDLASQILRRKAAHYWMQLLHPERSRAGTGRRGRRLRNTVRHSAEHNHAWHSGELSDSSRIPEYRGRQYRGDIGWLAFFNAACFFSRAIELSIDQLPAVFSGNLDDWRHDCARAAIRELGMIHRNPKHALDPGWLGTDPDLGPLRESPTGLAWMSFIGLRTPSVRVPRQASRRISNLSRVSRKSSQRQSGAES
jgi:tetratricopeptide (TPR) repeat protein